MVVAAPQAQWAGHCSHALCLLIHSILPATPYEEGSVTSIIPEATLLALPHTSHLGRSQEGVQEREEGREASDTTGRQSGDSCSGFRTWRTRDLRK